MKRIPLLMFFFTTLHVHSQSDKIGIIDVYGQTKTEINEVKSAIGLREGSRINLNTFDKREMEKRIEAIPGVVRADISLVCCDDKQGRSILFIGIDDQHRAEIRYHDTPSGEVRLDSYILTTYERYNRSLMEAVRTGNATENNDKGHVMLNYPPLLSLQDSLISYAASHEVLLQQTIHGSRYTEHRRAASWIIGFAADKGVIAGDLLHACFDQDETVRNNATRSLAVIARYANSNPAAAIKIPTEKFINMLHSIKWTDRNKATMLLEASTASGDSVILNVIRSQSLHQIEEMARWKNPGHAIFSLILLGRIAGIHESAIAAAFTVSDRNKLVDEWMEKIKTKFPNSDTR